MPQQNALYAELSVFENLDFYASINGVRPAAERNRRIDEVKHCSHLAFLVGFTGLSFLVARRAR